MLSSSQIFRKQCHQSELIFSSFFSLSANFSNSLYFYHIVYSLLLHQSIETNDRYRSKLTTNNVKVPSEATAAATDSVSAEIVSHKKTLLFNDTLQHMMIDMRNFIE